MTHEIKFVMLGIGSRNEPGGVCKPHWNGDFITSTVSINSMNWLPQKNNASRNEAHWLSPRGKASTMPSG